MSIARTPFSILGAAFLAVLAGFSRAQAQDMFAGVTVHAPDAFYDPPAQVPDRPGALIRHEALKDVTLPAGLKGWRILYTTSVDDQTPATAVATVFAPSEPRQGPLSVITWEHGTTGLVQKCMPSLSSAPALGIPAVEEAVKAGWAIVATDYSFTEKDGPHPYLIGEGEARAGLDALRAARQMPELSLDAKTVVWGHSQGGHSALWTGIIAAHYAPEIEVRGIVAFAPVTNATRLLDMNEPLDKRLGPYVAASYSRFYHDVFFEQAVRPEASEAAREIAGLCNLLPSEETQHIAELAESFEGRVLAPDPSTSFAARLVENIPDRPIPEPLLIVQGLDDGVVLPEATDDYVEERCKAKQSLDYWRFSDLDHSTIVRPGTQLDTPLAAWTAARLAGAKQANGCALKAF